MERYPIDWDTAHLRSSSRSGLTAPKRWRHWYICAACSHPTGDHLNKFDISPLNSMVDPFLLFSRADRGGRLLCGSAPPCKGRPRCLDRPPTCGYASFDRLGPLSVTRSWGKGGPKQVVREILDRFWTAGIGARSWPRHGWASRSRWSRRDIRCGRAGYVFNSLGAAP
jgi:hypothetical protein